ncbi:RnfH family protein [Agaribacterium sp. ZY112]|uniref:RnfH family protein n=1 Tax=Agaribacterium sp. ZY112 TaxID=3233574 RepID=UPI003526595D
MTDIEPIAVEVAYATPEKQLIIAVMVEPGTTAYDAALKSKVCEEFPEIDLESAKFGLFGQALGSKGLAAAREYVLQEGDRIEIYRPLIADPKEVRRKRAAAKKA